MAGIEVVLNTWLFWGVWLLIPVLAELLPALGSFFASFSRRRRNKLDFKARDAYPKITVIVPPRGSSQARFTALGSIENSNYPLSQIQVFLEGPSHESGEIALYNECRACFPRLRLMQLDMAQGEARALFNCEGKYVIELGGFLEKNALLHLVDRFERNPELNCMTGAVLPMPEKIQDTKQPERRLLRNLEFTEYAESSLAGRNRDSQRGAAETMFAFRKTFALSFMMRGANIGPRSRHSFRVLCMQEIGASPCESALCFMEPSKSLLALAARRQRWQREVLEGAAARPKGKGKGKGDKAARRRLYQTCLTFPCLLWYLAAFVWLALEQPDNLPLALGLLAAPFVLAALLDYLAVCISLKMMPSVRSYCRRRFLLIFLRPLYDFCMRLLSMACLAEAAAGRKRARQRNKLKAMASAVRRDGERGGKALALAREKLSREAGQEGAFPAPSYIVSGLLLLASVVLGLSASQSGGGEAVLVRVLALLAVAFYVLVLCLAIRSHRRGKGKSGKISGRPFARSLAVLCAVLLAASALYANGRGGLLLRYQSARVAAGFYEDYYVTPDASVLTAGREKKNLIYIYLENMETGYASLQAGGAQAENYIQGLTALAEENISFSDGESLGGFRSVTGTGYTTAALFSTSTGVPYALPVECSELVETKNFASGILSLGDILKAAGYNQEFLCGTDAALSGQELYFRQHGDYQIFDLFTARSLGYVDPDYYAFWGYEDKYLFEIAKDELERLAAEDAPFNLTMLTVDLHDIGGYVCELCGDEYEVDTANVAACTDKQVTEFIQWCQKQDFYKDTVIVISGSQPRMDARLMEAVAPERRTIYNCILNSAVKAEETRNRSFTPMDMFPTVLAAMGYTIEGERLGLGTNLFSGEPTLTEQLGFDYVDAELSKESAYYVEHFAPELSRTDSR